MIGDKETSGIFCKRKNTYASINMVESVDCGDSAVRQPCQHLGHVRENNRGYERKDLPWQVADARLTSMGHVPKPDAIEQL